jgi:crossover junction endodeoxyribonuclease RuvC
VVILGIDPGTRFAGYGIVCKDKQQAYLLDHGCLKLRPTESLQLRIHQFYTFFSEKIQMNGVTDLALETPFLGKNAQNFLKLGYLRGILYLLASQNNLVIHEFSPCQVKQSVTGFGGASKDQVARVILRLFPALEKPEREDVTDALAVTLCGLWKNKNSHLF